MATGNVMQARVWGTAISIDLKHFFSVNMYWPFNLIMNYLVDV